MSALVYFVRPVGQLGPVKIGCSVYPKARLQQLAHWSPFELEVVAEMDGDRSIEARLHRKFLDSQNRLEWFNWTPELETVIEQVKAGTFKVDSLPRYAGPLLGMRERIATYSPVDYDYLEAFREYSAREWKKVGWYQGQLPPLCVFQPKPDHEKRAILKGLRAYLRSRPDPELARAS